MKSKRVKEIIRFIEKLTIPSGYGQGAPFRLEAFQKQFIEGVYGPEKNSKRLVRRAVLSIGRKNGKTALIACMVLNHLIGPERVTNGEIYSAANEREQAAIVFKYVAQIIRLEPELEQMLRIVDSTKTIVSHANGSIYRAISAEAGSKHGLNPTVVIYDELAQSKNRDLYDALDTSMGAREEPLFVVISTQSADPQHVLSQIIDDGIKGLDRSIYVQLHAVPDDCEDPYDPKVWKLANPALGKFRSLEDLKVLAARAQRMPSFDAAFRNLYLNQRIDSSSPLIPYPVWMSCKDESCRIEPGEKIYLALDLSSTTDLSALAAVSLDNGDRVAAWFWKPGDLLDQHEDRDRVPYRAWRDMGLIEAPEGRAVNYGHIAMKLAELMQTYKVLGLAYDRWRIDLLVKELSGIGVDIWVDGKDNEIAGGLRLVPWGQGYKDMAPAIDAIETSVIEQKFRHNGNPVLTWNVSNAIVITDPAGNRKLDKSKSRFRIDGMIAATMAIGLKYREIEKKPQKSIYETRGMQGLTS